MQYLRLLTLSVPTFVLLISGQIHAQNITAACLVHTHWTTNLNCTPGDGEVCVGDANQTQGSGFCICGKPGSGCLSSNVSGETGCGSCGGAKAGKPISLAAGNTYIEQTDVRQLPGRGPGLALTRVWNSIWPATQAATSMGMFGNNWRSTYEEQVFVGSDTMVKYARADGSFWSFWKLGTTSYIAAPANQNVTLTSGGSWVITFQNGDQRIFDIRSGALTTIIDHNGNTTQLAYDISNRLISVTDPALRHLYFTYPNSSSYLVSAVTSDVGLSITYTYDTSNRLISVTENDGSTFTYEYDSNSKITAVKDANGKILEAHTYDSQGRGLTSVRANGVEAVAVSYQ